MAYKPSMRGMKIYLQGHGHQIDSMNDEEIFELYSQISGAEIKSFQEEVFDSSFLGIAQETPGLHKLSGVIKEEIKSIGSDAYKLQKLIDAYIEKFPFEELKFLIFSGVKKIPFLVVDRIVKIKSYQYQEIWLEKIAQNLEILPVEERSVLINQYQQFNISQLFKVYQKTLHQDEVEKMKAVAQNKFNLLKNFSPQLLESSYKAFYDESEEKSELIDEILKHTRSYSRGALKNLPFHQLNSLKEEILEQEKEKSKSKKRVIDHIRALEASMLMTHDSDFDAACMDAIAELNNLELQKVIDYLSARNKFFINRFESVARQFHSSSKNRIIT